MLMLQYSSNPDYSLEDKIVPVVPRISLVTPDYAGQSPTQLSDSSLFQCSGETIFDSRSECSWLAGEIERIPETGLHDLHSGPVEKRFLGEDLLPQAKKDSKKHDSAISKHLVKKAALEEKLKCWQLDSTVSNSTVDSDECAEEPSQSGLALEKRIRELKEALKQQDVAIQKHIIRKASLEREIKLWQPKSNNESGQPGKKLVSKTDKGDAFVSMPVKPQPKETPAQNEFKSNAKPLMLACGGGSAYGGANARSTEQPMSYSPRYYGSHSPRYYESHSSRYYGSHPDKHQSRMCTCELNRYSNQVMRRSTAQVQYRSATTQRSARTSNFDAHCHSCGCRNPAAFESDMDEMARTFERVDIGTGRSSSGRPRYR